MTGPSSRAFAANDQSAFSLRRRLKERQPFLALFSIIPAVEIVELAAFAGFDGIILDTEHGSYGTQTLPALILAARANGIFPVVRVRSNDPSLIGAALDAGAAGVLVPQIGSVAEAGQAVRAARFAPEGSRGANPWVRAGGYGFTPSWFETANDDAAILLMIEGRGALQAIDDILAIPGLDGIFLGPVDLSHALGVPGQIDHPIVRDAATSTIVRAIESGLTAGVFAPTGTLARTWLERGAGFVTVGVDTGHVGRALAEVMKTARTPVPADLVRADAI